MSKLNRLFNVTVYYREGTVGLRHLEPQTILAHDDLDARQKAIEIWTTPDEDGNVEIEDKSTVEFCEVEFTGTVDAFAMSKSK